MYRVRNNFIIYFFSLMILSIFFHPLQAFPAAISMEYSLGFNGQFQLEKWTPLTIVLENRGRATNGILEVIVTSGSEYLQNIHETTYSMDVELPYNSKKLCSFTILISTFTHDLILQLRQAEQIVLSESINLRPYYTNKSFIVVVDEKTSPDFLAMLPQHLLPVNVRPRFLPETGYGYDSVKLLIMNAEMIKNLRERQFQALQQWIRQGGYLVTAGGINYGALSEHRIQQLLPLSIIGHQQFSELPSLETFCGEPLSSSKPFLVLHASLKNADILVQERNVPIILQTTVGGGKIIFLAFDFQNPPFSRWPARRLFWESILALQPVIEYTGIELEDQQILSSLLSNMPAMFPNFFFTIGLIGMYVLCLKFCLNRFKRPGDTRWKNMSYLFITMILFSIASYGLFFYPTNKKRFTYNSFLHLNIAGQHKIALGQYIIGLYSLQDAEYTAHFGSGSLPILRPLTPNAPNAGQNIPYHYVLHETPAGQHLKGLARKWSYNFFLISVQVEFPIVGQAVFDEQNLRVMIENRTPYAIKNCRGYFNTRLFFLGDIAPDTQQTKTLNSSTITSKEVFDYREADQIMNESAIQERSPSLRGLQKDFTKEVLLAVHSQYESKHDTLYLIGWIETDIIGVNFLNPGIIGDSLTLVTWELPVKRGKK